MLVKAPDPDSSQPRHNQPMKVNQYCPDPTMKTAGPIWPLKKLREPIRKPNNPMHMIRIHISRSCSQGEQEPIYEGEKWGWQPLCITQQEAAIHSGGTYLPPHLEWELPSAGRTVPLVLTGLTCNWAILSSIPMVVDDDKLLPVMEENQLTPSR